MRNLKISTMTLASVFLLIFFTGCKKDNSEVKPDPKPIVTEELLGYQIVADLANPANDIPYRLFHFSLSGNEIMATMDGVQSRRMRTIKITGNRFTFDSDGDGKIVYEFNLKRDEKGVVIMETSSYKNLNDPTITMPYAVIWQSDFPAFKNKTFTSVDGASYVLQFTNDTWTWTGVPGKTGTFYEIAKGAWKGRLDGKDYMGFSAHQENGKLVMALTREGSSVEMVYE